MTDRTAGSVGPGPHGPYFPPSPGLRSAGVRR